MSSSTLLVVTLLVLWLIVLVPMIFRRVDDGAPARSVRRYGKTMRLLNRRHARTATPALSSYRTRVDSVVDEVSYIAPRITGARDELFVPGSKRGRMQASQGSGQGGRRPASAGREAQMNRAEMSDARRQMMDRRRRSLTILIAGSVLSLLLAFIVGGALLVMAAVAFTLGLGGYTYFLRSQALRDRERRAWRESRAHEHERVPYHEQAMVEEDYFDEVPETVVRIDDDYIDLHNLDTMDLTGVYNEADYEPLRERRAS